MTIHFHIEYGTMFGEQLVLNIQEDDEEKLKLPMATLNGKEWSVDWCVKQPAKAYTYYYSVERDGVVVKTEWLLVKHRLELTALKANNLTQYDYWKVIPEDAYLYSSAFTDCINHQAPEEMKEQNEAKTVRLVVRAPQLCDGDRLGVVGADNLLGSWNAKKMLKMTQHSYNEWVAELDAAHLQTRHMEFKFVAYNEKKDTLIWETSMNRTIDLPEMKTGDAIAYELDQVFFALYNRKLAGTQVPVFSLRSEKSAGVGDFGDLKTMIDLVASTGQKVLQLLPINDTTITHTWTDSYPYSCISVFAIHPMYADLNALPALKDKNACEKAEKTRQELNALHQIDYEKVNDFKQDYLQQIFAQEGKEMMSGADFKAFFQETQQWLVPYAQYSYLRDKNGTADFSQWPDHNVWDEAERKDLTNPETEAYQNVEFFYFVQFILNKQMQEAHGHAKAKGVILKGDIPIGVHRHSCDVWMEPKYFNLNGQAGAPPDDFSVNGQNWGFPTYNWDIMEEDGYRWWMRRFQKMAEYFDAYRIDHILGFFRIWEIPMHAVHGLLGQFTPSLPMSREEIESFGFTFRDEYLLPYIHESFLGQVFGPHTEFVKQNFLQTTDVSGIYHMKPGFETQREVENFFSDRKDEDSIWIREGLYSLISNVLFVPDKKEEGKYHPRIGVQRDFIFRSLSEVEKNAFNKLYDQYYYHRHNAFWQQQAMKKLPQLTQSTRMLVCGEDLGMIPDCVASVMNDLRILSLEIQRMPKNPLHEFGHLSEYPYRSVCTISTHDMSTLRGWWEEDYQQTQRYYNTILGHYGIAPTVATPELCEEVVRNHLNSNSILCILSLQDWLSIDGKWRNPNVQEERINVPSNPRNYWRYRMHLTLEQLMKAKELNKKIGELIKYTGRAPQK